MAPRLLLTVLAALLAGGPTTAAAHAAPHGGPARCSGSLVWRAAGHYALTLTCTHAVASLRVKPNRPFALSGVSSRACRKPVRGAVTCTSMRRLGATVTLSRDAACSLRLELSGRGMQPLSLLAVGCPVAPHFRVDYTGSATGIESADVFSTWTSTVSWAGHFGDVALVLSAPTTADSASRTASGTWQFNSSGCAGTIVDLDSSPARLYAVTGAIPGTYHVLVEAALHLGNGGVTTAGTDSLPCRQWDGGAIALRGTTAYPAGGPRISYTASLQALADFSYAALTNVGVGHSIAVALSGPAPALRPTSFTGPIVHWTGQLVLTRTR